MSTRHLTFSEDLPVTNLKSATAESVEIEVPAGESHYRIYQTDIIEGESRFTFHLRHPDSRLLLTGLVEARGETAPSLITKVVHHAPGTQAETLIRTLSYDKAAPHYQGLIRIEPKGQNSESYLNHHSLLLGPGSKSWTLPSLEIEANQVKCSHAATVRTITDLDLFYLRTRGLDAQSGRDLLIEAFVSDVV